MWPLETTAGVANELRVRRRHLQVLWLPRTGKGNDTRLGCRDSGDGAGWSLGPQHQRIIAGIFHPLYVVGFDGRALRRIDYVPAHMLGAYPSVFKPRKKLSETARRAGWQGFVYDLRELPPVAMQQMYPVAT
jgi:hypothetical protein